MVHRGLMGWGFVGGGRVLVLFLLVLAVAAAVAALVVALRGHTAPAQGAAAVAFPARSSDATRILDERYARGEIDDEEYQRRRALLTTP